MNRNRLIAGVALLTVLGVLVGLRVGRLWVKLKTGSPEVSQRVPISELSYCNADQTKLCIVSFSNDSNGNLVVNLLAPAASFPGFQLKIVRNRNESLYECQSIEGFPTNVYCIGPQMSLGETLQFKVISTAGNTLLAEGSFSIIGLALPTPIEEVPTSDILPTASPTQSLLILPTPTQPPGIR